MAPQVRVLQLNDRQYQTSVLYRLEKGWILRFTVGPSLLGHKVRLFTTHSESTDSSVSLNEFRELPWVSGSAHKYDDCDRYAEINCIHPGPSSYFFLVDTDDLNNIGGSGYFCVAPVLTFGESHREILSLDSIQCVTYISKLMGSFVDWEGRLRVAKESGYNMIHFTPVQQLGTSHSAYSISDFTKVNSLYNLPDGKPCSFDQIAGLIEKMRTEWNVLSLADVVWNHTSASSDWLKQHPECGYNVVNSPHLRPAFVVDRLLYYFGREVADGKLEEHGIPSYVKEEHHLEAIKSRLLDDVFPSGKLHEFFQVNIDAEFEKFTAALNTVNGPSENSSHEVPELEIVQDPEYRRFGSTVNITQALLLYNRKRCSPEQVSEVERRQVALSEFRTKLRDLNNQTAETCWNDLRGSIEGILGHIRYERVNPDGPRRSDYEGENHQLLTPYFTYFHADKNLVEDEKEAFDPVKGQLFFAHNGWVMGDDPLKNFADPPSMVYFKRQLISWGDSVKLRYGQSPKDCPYLWNLMKEYTISTAKIFHGVRIDNCHSTPIHVAEYLLHEARKVRPDLYVVAELFTGNPETDNIFVNRLGITSLIREAQTAWDAHEEGRLVYRYGGDPVGAFIQPDCRPLAPAIAHALLMDCTHDNQSPILKRSVYDLFPTAALVSMACCATGSSRGYDELIPHYIDIVKEKRQYCSWSESEVLHPGNVSFQTGILRGKRILNDLHMDLGKNGYSQIYVDQLCEDTVAVTRHNPETHRSVILVARTCFSPQSRNSGTWIPPLHLPGVVDEIIFEAGLTRPCKGDTGSSSGGHEIRSTRKKKIISEADHKFLLGLTEYKFNVQEHIKVYTSEMVEANVQEDTGNSDIDFTDFPPGSVIVFSSAMPREAKNAALSLRSTLIHFGYDMRTYSGKNLKSALAGGTHFENIITAMTLQDLNRALFRCHEEEMDEGKGFGAYHVSSGSFVYCGFQGIISEMMTIRATNDLGHPICDNIRQGDWLADYTANRLQQHPGTKELGIWLSKVWEGYKKLPHFLKPSYFDAVITGIYNFLIDAVWLKMADFVGGGSSYVKGLALGSVIFSGFCRSALLPQLPLNIQPPLPPDILDEGTGQKTQACTTVSAGLPHFACGIFRSWGRDTFISLPGILIIPGRYDEARYLILGYANTLRHGLIPNLLGGGKSARYNCRDAVWWWLHCIKVYVELVPNGDKILNDQVLRLFPTDDFVDGPPNKTEPLHETMQEALNRHFQGISFRERNAGWQIDEHMTDEGFNVEAGIHAQNGFVFGGNKHNCGTWMDKMGSSSKAGTKGKPATPRDGSAVELVALCAEVVGWLAEMHTAKKYPHGGVETSDGRKTSWKIWANLIEKNFEPNFWVAEDNRDPLANKRGIYKDTVGSSLPWADFQLRPNFVIALAVAPNLVNLEHAWIALEAAEKHLLGPLGMRTLDPTDWAYDGNYVNSDDSNDEKRARGFNYHQGPEWVWICGYFFRAKLVIAKRLDATKPGTFEGTVKQIQHLMTKHWGHIQNSPWRALPELTNADGELCKDSCPAQAWSMSCLMEVAFELNKLGRSGN